MKRNAIQSGIHAVVHRNAVAGVAIVSMDEGVLALNQWSRQFLRRPHLDYGGITLNLDERQRLVADLRDDLA